MILSKEDQDYDRQWDIVDAYYNNHERPGFDNLITQEDDIALRKYYLVDPRTQDVYKHRAHLNDTDPSLVKKATEAMYKIAIAEGVAIDGFMDILGTITEEDFHRPATPEKWPSYQTRPAVRAVLINEFSEIAVMYVAKHHYFKLPGGGIDDGESTNDALARELAEEVGAQDIEVVAAIGQVDEYRDQWEMKASHYGFVTRVIGVLRDPQRTGKEIKHGYETVWAKDIDEAIELIQSGTPSEYGQGFEKQRELTFLRAAKNSGLTYKKLPS